jgi:hypothetical protein
MSSKEVREALPDRGGGARRRGEGLPTEGAPTVPTEENSMTAAYTFDVFSTLDGFGSYNEDGDWGGFWGKEGPEFLAHR